jgi:hypothetical protein
MPYFQLETILLLEQDEQLTDPVLGSLTKNNYSYARKNEPINWWPGVDHIRLFVYTDGVPPSPIQRTAYLHYKKNIASVLAKGLVKLLHDVKTLWDDTAHINKTNLTKHLRPTLLGINDEGDWMISFDATFDEEHGVAIVCRKGKVDSDIPDNFY